MFTQEPRNNNRDGEGGFPGDRRNTGMWDEGDFPNDRRNAGMWDEGGLPGDQTDDHQQDRWDERSYIDTNNKLSIVVLVLSTIVVVLTTLTWYFGTFW